LQDYAAACRQFLAGIEARAAEDARVASSVIADDADPVVPWATVRDNVRKIR